MIKFYGYKKCSTCRNAEKALKKANKKYTFQDITEAPPSKSLLGKIVKSGQYTLPELFNRSGVLYREMKMKEKVKKLSEGELLELLAKNGKLVKRPIVTDGKKVTVGFREEEFRKTWKA